VGLFLGQVDAAVPGAVVERHLVGDGRVLDAGQRAQRGEVGLRKRPCVVVGADAAELHAHDVRFVEAADAVDRFQPPADQEQRVADDGAAQRDLQHDQRGGGLVPAQRGKNGTKFHGHALTAT
jgi:hypothetical protein